MATFPQVISSHPRVARHIPRDPTADLILDHVLHELRRALVAPTWHIHRGDCGIAQSMALAFGWLQPIPDDRRRLQPTSAGRQALHDSVCRRRKHPTKHPPL